MNNTTIITLDKDITTLSLSKYESPRNKSFIGLLIMAAMMFFQTSKGTANLMLMGLTDKQGYSINELFEIIPKEFLEMVGLKKTSQYSPTSLILHDKFCLTVDDISNYLARGMHTPSWYTALEKLKNNGAILEVV